jgi:hypothetical protein
VDLYPPSHRALTRFSLVTELHLEASHYTPGKPARNNIIFHRRCMHEMLFSIRLHCGLLDVFCMPAGLALVSSLHIDVVHLVQLTLLSMYPYDWLCFFHHLMPGHSSSARS